MGILAHGWRRSSVRSAIETRRLELAAQADRA
jgi:hypothetical protein